MSQEQPSTVLTTPPPISKDDDALLNSKPAKIWNTQKLGLRLGTDVVSAAIAAGSVAPVICLIDQSVIRKLATGTPILKGFLGTAKEALLRPHVFLLSRPLRIIFAVYSSTYITANTVDTLTSTVENKNAKHVSAGPTKFAATSVVNMSLSVYKDSQFAKIFGRSPGAATTIPKLTYALFACRDALTIFASFNLPTIIAPKLAELPPSVKNRFSRLLNTESGRMNTTQFIVPAAAQLFSTPLHLLGLDLYNRQKKLAFSDRGLLVARSWASATLARMGRIIPAFGVGGVVNAQLRRKWMPDTEQ